MPINLFKCRKCSETFKSLKAAPEHCGEVSEKVLTAPEAKFLEPTNKEKGKSVLKGQKELLTARAKEHSRQNDYHDAIQTNNQEMAKRVGWVREDGTTRKKIDNI